MDPQARWAPVVEHGGDGDPVLRSAVDAAEYGERGAASTVIDEAATSALRLTPAGA